MTRQLDLDVWFVERNKSWGRASAVPMKTLSKSKWTNMCGRTSMTLILRRGRLTIDFLVLNLFAMSGGIWSKPRVLQLKSPNPQRFWVESISEAPSILRILPPPWFSDGFPQPFSIMSWPPKRHAKRRSLQVSTNPRWPCCCHPQSSCHKPAVENAVVNRVVEWYDDWTNNDWTIVMIINLTNIPKHNNSNNKQ